MLAKLHRTANELFSKFIYCPTRFIINILHYTRKEYYIIKIKITLLKNNQHL